MMLNKITALRKEKKITEKQLAYACGLTVNGLRSIISRNDAKFSTLIKIADYFNVQIIFFFDDIITSETRTGDITIGNGSNNIQDNRVNGSGHNISVDQTYDRQKEVELLKQIIEMKDEIIELQRSIINNRAKIEND